MLRFPLVKVQDSCGRLSPLQKRRVLKLAGDDSATELGVGESVVFWLADLLQQTPLADADQRWLVLEELLPAVRRYGEVLAAALKHREKLPVACLGLADRVHVAFTGEPRVLDVTTGTWLPALPSPPFERIQYDLTLLVTQKLRALEWNGQSQ